jgi:hypothetical protein
MLYEVFWTDLVSSNEILQIISLQRWIWEDQVFTIGQNQPPQHTCPIWVFFLVFVTVICHFICLFFEIVAHLLIKICWYDRVVYGVSMTLKRITSQTSTSLSILDLDCSFLCSFYISSSNPLTFPFHTFMPLLLLRTFSFIFCLFR